MIRTVLNALAFVACTSFATAHAQPVTRVESGLLSGALQDGIASYRGIPFAAPPIGPLRWRAPAPPVDWNGVRDATHYGAACIQPERGDGGGGGRADVQSEDCLTLNVWAPENAAGLPVMVWIHGGGHRIGSGTFTIYDGSALARQGVVLVTINYRIGLLGYFAHPALTREAARRPLGNYGMMDQIAALEWIQRNIAAFGGDPQRVTVFGESAGGASTLYLLANPRAQGLFQGAIVQSGGGLQRPTSLPEQESRGVEAVQRIGLSANATMAQLRAVPAERWNDALGPLQGLGFGPFIDGQLITEAPSRAFAEGRALDLPLMIGANDNEASVIATLGGDGALALLGAGQEHLRSLYGEASDDEYRRQALGDAFFVAPAAWIAMQASGGAPSYLYHFTYVPERRRGRTPGAGHGTEIPHIFQSWDQLPIPHGFITDEDEAFGRMMSSCWVSFAQTGVPHCANGPEWPAYTRESDQLMLFAPQTRVAQQPRREAADFLLSVLTGPTP